MQTCKLGSSKSSSRPALGCNSRRSLVTTAAASTPSFPIPGRWLGPFSTPNTTPIDEPAEGAPRYGLELTADEWNPLGLPIQPTTVLAANMGGPGSNRSSAPGSNDSGGNFGDFLSGDLPKKLAILLGLLVFSRLGVYVRLPGVDVDRFAEAMSGSGLLGYIDTLSGGSISKVGVFSLGIVPYINASILLQLLATAFPSLKKLQREEGPQGRARFTLYQKLAALVFAVVQAVGQLTYIRPYVDDWSGLWLFDGVVTLTAGAVILLHVADTITELKLGNGTSVLIFANIASALPSSVGGALSQASTNEQANLAIYAFAFFLTTLGIVYVQDAERQIPMTYASRYRAGSLQRQAYLPFKVNATGVMPVIFSSSLLALPSAAARYINTPAMDSAAKALAPGGPFYLPTNVALIVAFNYLYTFLQLDPKELSEQLKRQGASIPGVRPGRNTAEFITKTLDRMSVLGSGFLGALAAAPALVEATTGLQAFRGFAGTSVLILVGVATDTARKFRAEIAMQKYGDIDRLYDDLKYDSIRRSQESFFYAIMATTLVNNIAEQQQQQHLLMPPPALLLHSGSLDGRSTYSSSTDMSRLNPEFDPNDDPNRSHHLLKHCLSNGQRNEALLHFGTDDVKEAAKEISKMGQRDLQGKFRLVYGTATHSNNNDWLRRKLYEAIGAAPIKATTKTKPRKATSSKPKKMAVPVDPLYHTSSAAPSGSGGDIMGERRSRRTTKGVHSSRHVGIGGAGGLSVAESLKRYRIAGGGSLPGSPVVGRSVIDMHKYLGHESATTSASEDEAGVWGSNNREEDAAADGTGDDDEQGGDGRAVRRRASADEYLPTNRPQSAFAPASRSMDLPAVPPHMRRGPGMVTAATAAAAGAGGLVSQTAAGLLARRASSAGLLGFSTLNLEFFQNVNDAWSSDAWADAALKAAAARKAPVTAPSAEDEDVMMLPMDLSAFNEDGAALL